TRVSADAQAAAIAHIKKEFGENFAPKTPNVFKSKDNAQDAHEAIRPISMDRTPASVMNSLSTENFKLYKLIYERFLASQMADAVYNNVNVDISAGEYSFKAIGKTVEFPGFTAVYKNYTEEKEEVSKIPVLTEGEMLKFVKFNAEQKFTKPPARYTEASLVKEMEELGIGRPATYAATITTIASRNYVAHDGKALKPTELGIAVTDYLNKFFKQVINVKFTADMETKLDQIAENGKNWEEVVESFWNSFSSLLTSAGATYEKIKVAPEETDVVCDKCGHKMVVREGRYGKFLGCSNYPNCNNIMKMTSAKPAYTPKVVGKCPECGKDVVVKRSKAGKIYYGCSGFPDCKYFTWTNPAKNVENPS
ncbi:MAG: type I DNA topoisomerase, partial [Clostridia bacterium]|nr:type I DNA topoisomerase [Clostridia bacterium]